MAFSDFKSIAEVQAKFSIKASKEGLIGVDTVLTPADQFLQEFEFNRQHFNTVGSEMARCETLIFPVLREVYKTYAEDYVLWIGESLAYDAILSGTPDYFIATKSELGGRILGTPLIIVVEAKKNDFEVGWGQCLAELIAAQKINAQNIKEHAALPVYGIVTDGMMWQFGKLVGDTFTENITPFSLGDMPRLFGAIDAVFKAFQNGNTAPPERKS
ncbi:hypothetical protein C6495_11740 [Candidatus Poribacteria bacterium]|nr:MAG: hypothetical protein C6495_11740 [Candidatus Poribacteria bacterium]